MTALLDNRRYSYGRASSRSRISSSCGDRRTSGCAGPGLAALESSLASDGAYALQLMSTADSGNGIIAGTQAQSYPQSSPKCAIQLPASSGDAPTLPIELVGAAVQTAIAQQSRKHSNS